MFYRELLLVRDSEDTTLKIISENGAEVSVSFHGRFPLQESRMLVRETTCLLEQGGCGR